MVIHIGLAVDLTPESEWTNLPFGKDRRLPMPAKLTPGSKAAMAIRFGRVIFWFMTALAVASLVAGAIIVASEWPHTAKASAHRWWLIVDHAGLAIVLAGCLFLFGRAVRNAMSNE